MPDLDPTVQAAEAPPGPEPAPQPAGMPEIKGFLETSFVDWPGRIAAVVFTAGCDFACPYCHNGTLVHAPQTLETYPHDYILGRLEPFVGWIDGVVVTGGEPTLHPGLAELLIHIKGLGLAVKLDTNGHHPAVLRDLVDRGLVDTVAMDLKAPLEPLAYARAAGKPVDIDAITHSVRFLIESRFPHQFRSTIWPAWHGSYEMAAMAESLRGAQRWTLQAMNPDTAWRPGALGSGDPYSPRELALLQNELADPVCRP